MKERKNRSRMASWAEDYENILMEPLQPLLYDLHTVTYETFELDPVKYNLYEKAFYKALLDMSLRRRGGDKLKKM